MKVSVEVLKHLTVDERQDICDTLKPVICKQIHCAECPFDADNYENVIKELEIIVKESNKKLENNLCNSCDILLSCDINKDDNSCTYSRKEGVIC